MKNEDCRMSNFETTEKNYQQYAKLATSAESLIYSDPKSSVAIFGNFAEQLTREIMHLEGFGDWNLKQIDRINELKYRADYPPIVTKDLDDIRRIRNLADHDHQFTVSKKQALEIDEKAHLIWSYFLEVYSQDNPAKYQTPIDQANIFQVQQAQIDQLKKELEAALNGQKPVEVSKEVREQRRKISVNFAKKHQLTEAETRQLIDNQLREAGWEANTEELNNWKHKTEPQKGHNMAIAEWVLPNGQRADYALFRGLEFYGIVEAKKWDQDIAGQMAQPKEYSKEVPFRSDYLLVDNQMGDYKVPFIYTANGRPYLKQYKEKSGIWFWDARNPKENAYALEEFHHPEDLALKLTAQNPDEANEALVDDQDFPKFADRDYQVEAIKNIEEAIKDGKKRILLAMATGTGKTRTAISLMYRLLKHKRARRILYLVDRNSLGKQTAGAIKDNKVDNKSVADIYELKELTDKLPDASTKIQIATVQGMIKRLFYNDNEEKPSVGQYDFIIVDEAHRGYSEDKDMSSNEYKYYGQEDYVSQYRRVVDYFDATAIGMTATPALQTVEIFGEPVYSYSYQQAVLDGYLVDHDAPIIIQTELSQEGIHFKKGAEVSLFDQEEKTINKEKLPDNMDFELKDFNKGVINENFNKVVCDQLAQQYLDPSDSDLGKTLIFAATDEHADMVVTLLKQAFKDAGNPVDDDAIEKITGSIRHPNAEIKKFKNEKYPNIVVTVDLLTTGVDVPEITNIVFLRRVQSRILYEQMLGRATRLRPEINKSKFTIFDAVGIYDAMNKVTNMKPVVKNPGHNVHYFLQHKEDFFEINDDVATYQIDMSGAIERKVKILDEQKKKEFERLAEVKSIDAWARGLSKMNKEQFLEQWPKFERLDELKVKKSVQYISDAEDKVVNVIRGYGKNNQKPEDYIENFDNFIKKNIDVIPALQVVATRPKDLTLDELKDIKLKLEQSGFKENDLQTAWKTTKHVQTTADIISFIRQATTGSELIDHDVRIHNAMQKVYGLANWTVPQRKWLKKIENQLRVNTVLGPTAEEAFDKNLYFKRLGGYKQMKKIFQDNADQIIYVLNENLYV